MSAISKASWPMYLAYMLGRYTTRRADWMTEARIAKTAGRSAESIRRRVGHARDANRDVLWALAQLRRAGAL